MLEADRPDIDRRTAVEDRLADGENRVLLLQSPEDMHRHRALRKHGVDHEAVARVDGLLAPQVEHHELAMDLGAAAQLFLEPVLVLLVKVARVDHVIGHLVGPARRLARMVVERDVAARHVGKVGDDVAARDGHRAVLHVLGVHELDVVDQVDFAEQHAADQAVEVAAGYEAVVPRRHGGPTHGYCGQHGAAKTLSRG